MKKTPFFRCSVARVALLAAFVVPLLAGCASSSSREAKEFVTLAHKMDAQGNKPLAVDFYRRALAHDEDNLQAWVGLADLLRQIGDKEGELDALLHATRLAPHDPVLQRRYGRLLLVLEKPLDAKAAFEAALHEDPHNAKLLGELAVALDCASEHKEAQKVYAKALALAPDNLPLANNLGYSFILGEDYASALRVLEPLAKRSDATPALRQNLALAYAMSGMDADAMRMLKKDLSPAKARETLDDYKRKRAEEIVSSSPYVELGSYATEAMAEAVALRLKPRILAADDEMKPVIEPELSAPGGTPRFSLRLMSCANPETLRTFCDELVKSGVPCHPYVQ